MKLRVTIFVLMLIMFSSMCVLSQTGFWDKSQRVTSGYIDKNPAFDSKRTINIGNKYIALLVFERSTSLSNSNICVIKFGYDSTFGGVKYITNDANVINRNPRIAFKSGNTDSIQNAMLVWERVENSRVNIYGCTYNNSVWSAPYPIDTGAGIKSKPHITYNTALSNSSLYSIVYERNGDIIFKNYESVLNQIWNDINLTDTDTAVCKNPKVSALINYAQPIFIAYERQKTNGDYAIYYKKATTNYIFTGDTVSLRGNNKNVEFVNGFSYASISFESNFTGKWGVYEYIYNLSTQINPLLQSPAINYRNLKNFMHPVITNQPMYSSMLSSYIVQRVNATKIFSSHHISTPVYDSITVGDSSSKCVMTMGSGLIRNGTWNIRMWIVYEKDSAGFTMLEARGRLVSLNGINKIGTEVPNAYSLSQNYPNPFNPTTKIRFDIPRWRGEGGWTTLRVYDITGREVQTLVNERLHAGTYEVTFNIESATEHRRTFGTGVYFYKLVVNGESETKKMLLLK